ncbi:hypothetical protein D8S78_20345 [Natrialba swarupiae]|nr:hypothetical protein [Natrialba swarupiae]
MWWSMTVSADLIGDAYSAAHVWDVLERLTDVESRAAGSDGEMEAARILAETFERYDCNNVERRQFSIPGWTRGRSALTVHGESDRQYDRSHQVLALPARRQQP